MTKGWRVRFFIFVILLSMVFLSLMVSQARLKLGAFIQQTSAGQAISLTDAIALTGNYRKTAAPGGVLGECFGRDAILSILNQPGAAGIRIYYGRKSDGTPALVLVGINGTYQDMTGGTLIERGWPCPPVCDSTGHLSP